MHCSHAAAAQPLAMASGMGEPGRAAAALPLAKTRAFPATADGMMG